MPANDLNRPRRFNPRAGKVSVQGHELRHVPRCIGLVRSAAGRWATVWALLLGLQGLLPVAYVFLSRELANSLRALKL